MIDEFRYLSLHPHTYSKKWLSWRWNHCLSIHWFPRNWCGVSNRRNIFWENEWNIHRNQSALFNVCHQHFGDSYCLIWQFITKLSNLTWLFSTGDHRLCHLLPSPHCHYKINFNHKSCLCWLQPMLKLRIWNSLIMVGRLQWKRNDLWHSIPIYY